MVVLKEINDSSFSTETVEKIELYAFMYKKVLAFKPGKGVQSF